MAMDGTGLSVADALALERNNNDNGMFGGSGMWMVFFLFFLLAWGGGGWGGFGNNSASTQGALTRGELCQDMNFQSLENSVRGVQSGLCDGFYAMNTGILNGFSGVQRDMCTGFSAVNQGFNGVNQNINQARFDMQNCCCQTQQAIAENRYAAEKNTCEIINASNANAQRIIDAMTQNEMQTLRDQLQTANFQLSQQAQNAYLISAIRPTPIPAYQTCSPYESAYYARFGSGCGCNA
jgi:hypothetical protein